MQETFKNLKTIASLHTSEMTLSEIALEYQKTKSPILYAHIFCKMYPYLYTQAEKYFYLTAEDKISFILEELERALMAYEANREAQVQRLVSVYVNNRLRTETQSLSHHKRCANNTANSYDEVIATNDDFECLNDVFNKVLTEMALKESDLSDSEMLCCKIIMNEPHELKNTEIATEMGITSAGVAYLKKKLAVKLQYAF